MNSQKFIPEVGQIITRLLIGPADGSIEMSLVFRDRMNDNFHYQELARFCHGKTAPKFCGGVECAEERFGTTASGNIVVRSLASQENLCLMYDTWDKRYATGEWFANIRFFQKNSVLLETEVERIAMAFRLPHHPSSK